MKKGVSLITLIITVVIIIILTTVVIFNFTDNNSIGTARISVLATSKQNLQTDIELYHDYAVAQTSKSYFNKSENILLGVDGNNKYRITELVYRYRSRFCI